MKKISFFVISEVTAAAKASVCTYSIFGSREIYQPVRCSLFTYLIFIILFILSLSIASLHAFFPLFIFPWFSLIPLHLFVCPLLRVYFLFARQFNRLILSYRLFVASSIYFFIILTLSINFSSQFFSSHRLITVIHISFPFLLSAVFINYFIYYLMSFSFFLPFFMQLPYYLLFSISIHSNHFGTIVYYQFFKISFFTRAILLPKGRSQTIPLLVCVKAVERPFVENFNCKRLKTSLHFHVQQEWVRLFLQN